MAAPPIFDDAPAAAPDMTDDSIDLAEEAPGEVAEEADEVVRASELPGLPEGIAAVLIAAGLDDVVELVSMSEQQLAAVEGLSPVM